MAKGLMFLSSGMRTFKQLDELRQKCNLGVDSIIMRTGGLLDISHVTYRRWLKYLQAAELEILKGNPVLIKSAPTNKVTLQMSICVTMLQSAIDKRILPVDASIPGKFERQQLAINMIKADMAASLRRSKHITIQDLDQMHMAEQRRAIENKLRMRGETADFDVD